MIEIRSPGSPRATTQGLPSKSVDAQRTQTENRHPIFKDKQIHNTTKVTRHRKDKKRRGNFHIFNTGFALHYETFNLKLLN